MGEPTVPAFHYEVHADPTDPEPVWPLERKPPLFAVIGRVRGRPGPALDLAWSGPEKDRCVTRGTFERFLRGLGLQFRAPIAAWGDGVPLYVSTLDDFDEAALRAQLESAVYVAPALAARAVAELREDPCFRASERLLRAVRALLDAGPEGLVVEILDAGPRDLAADFLDAPSVERSSLTALHPYSHPSLHARHQLVFLADALSTTGADDELLRQLSVFAQRAGIPMVAPLAPAGDAAESEAVTAWRRTEAASWVALAPAFEPIAEAAAKNLHARGWCGPLEGEADRAAGRGEDPTLACFSFTLLVARVVDELFDVHYRRVYCRGVETQVAVAAEMEAGLENRLGSLLGPIELAPCDGVGMLALSFVVPGQDGAPGTPIRRRVPLPRAG